MAKAGFYFIGNMDKDDDSAVCFVCGKTLDGWENTDEPWIEHKKHSANCKFVQMRRCEDDLTVCSCKLQPLIHVLIHIFLFF